MSHLQVPEMGALQKHPSVSSMQSMASLGHLPPGHGYVPRRYKPDKPMGLSFTTRMNFTHRGPGQKYLRYAVVCGALAGLFFLAATIYFGLRNVCRMIVLRTEVLGAVMVVAGILLVSAAGQLVYKARVESNRWRSYIRFRPEGLYWAAAVSVDEIQQGSNLKTGTYGRKALRNIPKPKQKRKKGGKLSAANTSTPGTPTSAPPGFGKPYTGGSTERFHLPEVRSIQMQPLPHMPHHGAGVRLQAPTYGAQPPAWGHARPSDGNESESMI